MDHNYPVEVVVFEEERYDGEWIPESLVKAIAWLQAKMEEIPSEWRPNATIEIESNGSWENTHYAAIKLSYRRPATDEEIKKRIKEEKAQAKRYLDEARQRLAQEEARVAALKD